MDREKELVNPLREETIIVRFIPKEGSETDKRHVLFGGMAEGSHRTFTVPVIGSTNTMKDVLTKEEKAYFESVLGLNLSVLTKVDNYWVNFKVILGKEDTYLDLSKVEDYLKYKVLLANNNFICKSLEEYDRRPLTTYQYVLISEGQELKMAVNKRQLRKECYKLAGKIESDFDMLKVVIEMLDRRPVSDKTSITFLANKLDEYIEENASEVYKLLNNPALKTIVFVKKCVRAGLIIKTGDFYYLKSGRAKVPMAEDGKDPVIEQAVKFINNPKNQETKFALESQLKNPVSEAEETKETREPEMPELPEIPESTGAEQ